MAAISPELLSPALYAIAASKGRWHPAPHLMLLDKAVVDCIDGRDPARILVVEMPPRHGKSEFCSRYLPSWFVGTHRNKRVMLCSYSSDLARTFGRTARDLVKWNGHRFGVSVRSDVNAANNWLLQDAVGGMMTAGVGGSLTGFGADLAIIDDPLKNAEEALSDRIREQQIEWFKSTLWTRIEPGGLLLVIQTRWHKDDLAGWLLGHATDELGVPVRKLSLPAIAREGIDDPLGRQAGEPLWPERWPLSALESKRQINEGYWWEALYQQNPGTYGQTEWPDSYFDSIWADRWPDRFDEVVVALDPSKGKQQHRGDYSAIVTVGLNGGKLWVDADLERRPTEKMVEDLLRAGGAARASAVGIEVNAFQELLAPIVQAKARVVGYWPPQIVKYNNTVSKEIRIARLGAPLERGLYRFRRNPGTELLVKQLRNWPFDDHDDGPDALEMATRLLRDTLSKGRTKSDRSEREAERWSTSYGELTGTR